MLFTIYYTPIPADRWRNLVIFPEFIIFFTANITDISSFFNCHSHENHPGMAGATGIHLKLSGFRIKSGMTNEDRY